MATKKAKKQEFPETVYVYRNIYEDVRFLLAEEDVKDINSAEDRVLVGVYRLEKLVNVKREIVVTVEE
jgi:hypothetical protein